MKVHRLEQEQILPAPLAEVWAFFSVPRNLEKIMPTNMPFRTLHGADEPMYAGQLITNEVMPIRPIWMTWVTEITQVVAESYFIDEQRFGPYQLWHHRHHFSETAEGQTLMLDTVDYAMPFWPLGEIPHQLFVKKQLADLFAYRRERLEEIFGQS